MGYYFLREIIERITGEALERYLERTFYAPMGLATIGFRPLERFSRDRIVPTEYDVEFRHEQVWGDVHDPGAAMMGGVAGHAGLFSDASDLAVILQMLLNKGEYNGRRYLSEVVVAEFTKCQFCAPGTGPMTEKDNRRGLGWDKPQPRGKEGPSCDCVSYASFGHTGFTGTMVWADPETKSLYVFLSNRVYPNAANKKLMGMSIRTRIQEVVNDAISARQPAPPR
jgi:CubicO group peptidase (beta-lactamase class C family)